MLEWADNGSTGSISWDVAWDALPAELICPCCGYSHSVCRRGWASLCLKAQRRVPRKLREEQRIEAARWEFLCLLANPEPDWLPGTEPVALRSCIMYGARMQRAQVLPYRRTLRPQIRSRRRREWRPRGRRGVA